MKISGSHIIEACRKCWEHKPDLFGIIHCVYDLHSPKEIKDLDSILDDCPLETAPEELL